MTSLKFNIGPDFSVETDWFGTLALAGLAFALVWLILHYLTSESSATWDMPVVGNGTADEPARFELLSLSPIPTSDS
jgi:hypothetical protein